METLQKAERLSWRQAAERVAADASLDHYPSIVRQLNRRRSQRHEPPPHLNLLTGMSYGLYRRVDEHLTALSEESKRYALPRARLLEMAAELEALQELLEQRLAEISGLPHKTAIKIIADQLAKYPALREVLSPGKVLQKEWGRLGTLKGQAERLRGALGRKYHFLRKG